MAFYLPIEVRFVFIHIDVVEWILSEPGVDSESVLVRPFGNWRQCYGLEGRIHTLDQILSVLIVINIPLSQSLLHQSTPCTGGAKCQFNKMC